MKKIKIITFLFVLFSTLACKEQLDVKNPNQPTVSSANTESGIIAFATGAIYANGFRDLQFSDGVFGTFWSGAVGFHEMMGDMVGVEAANAFINQLGCPDVVVLDNGTRVPNPQSPNTQKALIRAINSNSNQGNNPLYYEWAYMYAMNNGANNILELLDKVTFSGNATNKKATLTAWAYWWKGFAYSRIGSIYYAGLINSEAAKTNSNYVSKERMIEEANANFDKAIAALNGLDGSSDYVDVMTKLIPEINQIGKGGTPTPAQWKRNINTFKARNILVNTPLAAMSPAQWSAITALVNDGVRANDNVFTMRTNANGDLMAPQTGTVAARATGNPNGTAGYKVSERLVQEFKTGDRRLANNFLQLPRAWIGNSDRGNAFNTRWQMIDGGSGIAGVAVLGSRQAGVYEMYIGGSYEENELMKAEALINSGNISGGLQVIDALRNSQGAGLAPVSGGNLTLAAAREELRRERRITLAFRGFSFYDARRWGVLDNGRTGAVVVNNSGVLNTNATITYGYLDYWDVPDNELAYNPASGTSAPVKNPK